MTLRSTALLLFVGTCLYAQDELQNDSTRVLEEVVVKAYQSNRPASEVPVAIGVIDRKELGRFGNTSFVSAVNTIAGARMEERSPGSYRFSIRGSLLRSPFGVRNVKFYWKGLPLTDGGGNTYLNLLDFGAVNSMEIIKGPGSSLYGASTGGVVLLEPASPGRDLSLRLDGYYGSYGTFRAGVQGNVLRSRKTAMTVGAAIQQGNGYREQSAMTRLGFNFDWVTAINNRSTLSGTILSSQLYYETPGGLNKTQFEANPRQARQPTPTLPGAVDQQASIRNITQYVGLVYDNDWTEAWSTRFGLYGSFTNFKNPAVLNFEEREELNWGGRTSTEFHFGPEDSKHKLTFGGEFQHFGSPISVYDNNLGVKGNIRTHDKLWSDLALGFVQFDFALPLDFFLTVGGSANFLKYRFFRDTPAPEVEQVKSFDPGFFPRVALLKKLTDKISVYTSLSNGFSAPTLAEVRPSTGNFNAGLNPERGRNIELGFKTALLPGGLQLNAAVYDFQLDETIVVQNNVNGADYFQNAGATSQRGLEAMGSWLTNMGSVKIRLWSSYTLNDYSFKNYVSNNNDYSGNELTGVAPDVVVSGLDLDLSNKWYLTSTVNFTDHLPLNDGNTEYASSYTLVSLRVGTRQEAKQFKYEVFAGGDNLLDETYSLGNDLNAAGGRYYNAAPGRNFYMGISFRVK